VEQKEEREREETFFGKKVEKKFQNFCRQSVRHTNSPSR